MESRQEAYGIPGQRRAAALPETPSVVFFDVDDTLLRGASGAFAARVLAARGLIARRKVARAIVWAILHRLGRAPVERLYREAAGAFRGMPFDVVRDVAEETFERFIRPRLYQDGERLVGAHLERGDTVVLLSAGPDLVIAALARYLGAAEFIASAGVIGPDGRYTGDAVRPFCYGEGKVALAEKCASRRGSALERCIFYSDSITDLPLLSRVAIPRVVNPDRSLRKVAAARGWDVLYLER